jgi:hypothetical protein
MKTGSLFHRDRSNASGDSQSAQEKEQASTHSGGTAPFLPEQSFSDFMLTSPLAGSELSIPRDYVVDRDIEIQP